MTTRRKSPTSLGDLFIEAVASFREAIVPEEEFAEDPVSPADLEGLSLEDATAELPERLSAAFDLGKLVRDVDAIACWADARDAVREATERFLRGRRAAIAVTGQIGSGRTAFLDLVERVLRSHPEGGEVVLTRLALESIEAREGELPEQLCAALGQKDVGTAEQLRERLADGSRRVIVLERAHNLYIRRIGGFQVLREALSLLGSSKQVLWVVESDAFAWSYLDQLFQLGSYFDPVVAVPLLGPADLRTVFERQLDTVSDLFPLRVLPPKGLGPEERARWREDGLWERLHQASQGNPQAASLLFRRSLRWSEHLHTAYLLPPAIYPFRKALASFSKTTLLALALILEHETLTGVQLAELLLLSPGEAQGILDGLARYHAVTRSPSAGYAVTTPWLAALSEHLSEWNIL